MYLHNESLHHMSSDLHIDAAAAAVAVDSTAVWIA
jgi:hypothetical protein